MVTRAALLELEELRVRAATAAPPRDGDHVAALVVWGPHPANHAAHDVARFEGGRLPQIEHGLLPVRRRRRRRSGKHCVHPAGSREGEERVEVHDERVQDAAARQRQLEGRREVELAVGHRRDVEALHEGRRREQRRRRHHLHGRLDARTLCERRHREAVNVLPEGEPIVAGGCHQHFHVRRKQEAIRREEALPSNKYRR
mmetsp:Transcript_11581/g.26765  ORF Transcript_11581/g.26765 Transcript_11581/m.26765 type:complete len:200 (+) Transcript_11581:391-990(+)